MVQTSGSRIQLNRNHFLMIFEETSSKLLKQLMDALRHLGMNVVQITGVIYIDQDVHIDELNHFKLKPDQGLQKVKPLSKDLTIVLLAMTGKHLHSYN